MATEKTTTTAGGAKVVKQYYSNLLLMRAVPQFVYSKFAQIGTIPKGSGNKVEFRRYGSLAAATTPLTEGSPPAGSNLTVTLIEATLAQYGDFVEMSDLLVDTAIDPVVEVTIEIQADQAADTWDQVSRDTLAAGTNVLYGGTATARDEIETTHKFTSELVLQAVTAMKNAKAKKIMVEGFGMVYPCFVSPEQGADLMRDSDWKEANRRANNAVNIMAGVLGMLHGALFIESNNPKIFAGAGVGSIDVHAAIMVGAQGYGISPLEGRAGEVILKPIGSAGTADPLNQKGSVGWKSAFATKRLNEAFLLRIETSVT